METKWTDIASAKNVLSVSHHDRKVAFVHGASPDANVLTLCDRDDQKPTSPPTASSKLRECRFVGEEKIGSRVLLEEATESIFVTLNDERRVAVFPVQNYMQNVTDFKVADLSFKSSILSLQRMGNAQNPVVAAVSSGAEVTLMQAVVGSPVTCKRVDKLDMQTVVATCVFGDDRLVVFGIRGDCLVFVVVHVAGEGALSSCCVSVSSSVAIPAPSVSAFSMHEGKVVRGAVCAACLLPRCAIILFADGVVAVVAPGRVTGRAAPQGLEEWFPEEGSVADADTSPTAIQTFQLSPEPTDDGGGDASLDSNALGGDITHVGRHFIAIAYGQCVSVWDTIYHVPHGFTHVEQDVRMLHVDSGRTDVAVAHGGGVRCVRFKQRQVDVPPTLVMAIRRKASCDAIVHTMRAVSEGCPMRAHAVTAAPMQAAADAGGDTPHVFERPLKLERDRELREVRTVLNRHLSSDAQAVRALVADYADPDACMVGGVRRLPSDRFAAAFVARCLYEMAAAGDGRFAVPLVDMIGTGVVSAEGVLAALDMSSTWGEGKKENTLSVTSLSELVTSSGRFFNVLEAIIDRVADVQEADIVLILQFSVLLCGDCRVRAEKRKSPNPKMAKKKGAETEQKMTLARSRRLLFKCLRLGVEKERLLKCLVQVPFSGVVILLNELNHLLKDCSDGIDNGCLKELGLIAGKAEQSVKDGRSFDEQAAMEYRGVGRWLDDGSDNMKGSGKTDAEGCVEWIGHILDAHLSSLILDDKGREIAMQLLRTVEQERRDNEVLQDLKGMTCHISERRRLPKHREDRYKVTVAKVSKEGALL